MNSLKRIKTLLFFRVARLPMNGLKRSRFVHMGGVDVPVNHVYIGEKVSFDTLYPENIHIGSHVHITANVTILTHYLDTSKEGIHWRSGHVFIGDFSFIGTGTIISKDIRIGKNVIIGAGSIVTKDIPDNEIWAGNPARFIKKRETIKEE